MLADGGAVTQDAREKHHPLLDDHPALEHGLEGRQHLVERGRGEEAEPAQVDTHDRHPEISDRTRHGEQRAVAAEDDQQVREARELRLVRGGSADRRDDAGGFLLEGDVDVPFGEPVDEASDDFRRPRGVGLRDDPDPFHASATTV